MNELESAEKIAKDIAKLERNLNQVAHIEFEGKEKEVYDTEEHVEFLQGSAPRQFGFTQIPPYPVAFVLADLCRCIFLVGAPLAEHLEGDYR